MAKGFWDDYNKEQQRIMEQREKANKGQKHKPLTVGNGSRTPADTKKKPAPKKKG